MASYVPSQQEERQRMLRTLGLERVEELFGAIPPQMLIQGLGLPPGSPELVVRRQMQALAAENKRFPVIFRGAGAYAHFIPAIVRSAAGKEQFITAYTPYQAEISQGILQSIFEFQTMICRLTGMDCANASVYDGASAAAEAVNLCRERKRNRAYISAAAHPMVIETIRTYCYGNGIQVELVPMRGGRTDPAALAAMLGEDAACLYVQQPNYYGVIEDAVALGQAVHQAGGKYIIGFNPIAAAILKTPAECGADVAVGEGQPLGLPLAFGGPYLGLMAVRQELMRRLPGRIVGQTVDAEGRRAFVLTLQAREQHIRREKASSNICSNQALCALTAGAYLAAMGDKGLAQAAENCYAHAHYLAERLASLGFKPRYDAPFFHEFLTDCPFAPERVLSALEAEGILGGLPVEGGILWCATELNSKREIDHLTALLRKEAAQCS